MTGTSCVRTFLKYCFLVAPSKMFVVFLFNIGKRPIFLKWKDLNNYSSRKTATITMTITQMALVKSSNIIVRLKMLKAMSSRGIELMTLRSTLASDSSGFVVFGISTTLVLWLSGGMYAQVPHVVVVAFLEVWVEPDQRPVLHLPKQQRPMARISALPANIDHVFFRPRQATTSPSVGGREELRAAARLSPTLEAAKVSSPAFRSKPVIRI